MPPPVTPVGVGDGVASGDLRGFWLAGCGVCGDVVCGAFEGTGFGLGAFVGAAVGLGVGRGVGFGVGRGVGRGVGLGGGARVTVTVGPFRLGSLPRAVAR